MSKSKPLDISDDRPVLIAVASFGGHLVQLKRIVKPFEEKYKIVYISTAEEAKTKDESDFYVVEDFSRTDAWKLFKNFALIRRIIKKEKPVAVISTGAAPGLTAILVARMMGVPTLWVDSIANAEQLSMCGKIASRIATQTLTQWKHLADGKVQYHGSVF